jgi:hypothetical protein
MNAARALALLAAAAGLAACSAFDPYATYADPAKAGQTEAGPRVSICYDTVISSLDEARAAAQRQCPANTQATPLATDWLMQYCPLLLPARATFVCAASK